MDGIKIDYDPYDIDIHRPCVLRQESPTDDQKKERQPLGPLEDLEYNYPPSRYSDDNPSLESFRPATPPKLLEPSKPLEKIIKIEDFDFPERNSPETEQAKKINWPTKILVLALFIIFFLNLGLNVSDTVKSQIKFEKITSFIQFSLEESSLKADLLKHKNFENNLQHGPAFSYIDNRTKVLTILCYPEKIIRQFTLEYNFNFSDCSLNK